MYINTCREGAKRMEPGSFQWCPGTGPKQWAQNETQELPSEHQQTLSYCGGDRALAQVAQICCGVSTLGDIQKLYAHGPGQPVVGGPA